MKRHLLLLSFLLPIASVAHSDGEFLPRSQMDSINERIDSTLKAYNDNDFQGFFRYFTQASAKVATEQAFQSVYRETAFAKYGRYLSRVLDGERSRVSGKVGLLFFAGQFERGPAQISVNLYRESSDWSLQQLRIEPPKP